MKYGSTTRSRKEETWYRCKDGTGAAWLEFDHHHGMNAQGSVSAVKAGMTPLEAIEAGTANAPVRWDLKHQDPG